MRLHKQPEKQRIFNGQEEVGMVLRGLTKRSGEEGMQPHPAIIILCSIFISLTLSSGARAERAVMPGSLPAMKGAEYVGAEMCASCHEKESKEYRMSTHGRLDIKGVDGVATSCEMCHGPGSNHVNAGGGKGSIINPKKNPEICFSCHMEKKMEFRLPYRHPVLEGKMSCSDCHSAHGLDARPWTTTSIEGVNEACFKCHADKRGPFVWEHEALRDGCQVCHKVHGSVNDKMLVARDSNLCLRCHIQTDFPVVGDGNHNSRLMQGNCWAAGCHNMPHGSSFDRHFRF